MKNFGKWIVLLSVTGIISLGCDTESPIDPIEVSPPASYNFERGGSSSVSFSGQSARIAMSEELISAMMNPNGTSVTNLIEMYRNETLAAGDANPFSSSDLNSSTKSIKSKVASSKDFFSSNTAEGSQLKEAFEILLTSQVEEVFPNWETLASPGVAGQVADGSSTRYVSKSGLEYNQIVAKGLIGALMLDQINNHYLSSDKLDEGSGRLNNDSSVLEEDANHTAMEHSWDEAFGYLFGAAPDASNPLATLGADDSFLNKYLGSVNGNANFSGIAQSVYDAFKLGRAAIVAHNYDLRDAQAEIIRENLSLVIAVRAVHYLQEGKIKIENGNRTSAFHALSEAAGFISSLRFTRLPNIKEPYIAPSEINSYLTGLLAGSGGGFWDITPAYLDEVSTEISKAFGFEVSKAI